MNNSSLPDLIDLDEHKGTMFAGQFIPQNFSTVQLEGIEEIAPNINVDPVQLINEARHMRVVDKDVIRNNASLLFMIVNFITRLGMKAAELQQTGDALQKTRDELEIIVQDRTVELKCGLKVNRVKGVLLLLLLPYQYNRKQELKKIYQL
jgi:hypothetical protein